jgi:membrane protein DedA with SNARE-associated domain
VTAYLLLALTAFTAQAALVVPLVPVLVSGGALAARGEMDPWLAILALAAGVIPGDSLWFWLGRKRGARVLGRVCRLALEPNTCVRRAQNVLRGATAPARSWSPSSFLVSAPSPCRWPALTG